ncbi:hypothetical protein [Nocardia brasiliensis]|uniref:hypothetical protein n=1 Tax=Nocardia brasiliensis TaxID=37326 RepID=UPI0004A72877|nr:hypothetical protein [Nocardia brasiliensis]
MTVGAHRVLVPHPPRRLLAQLPAVRNESGYLAAAMRRADCAASVGPTAVDATASRCTAMTWALHPNWSTADIEKNVEVMARRQSRLTDSANALDGLHRGVPARGRVTA